MKVELDELESLWPPYRGGVLLRVAQESQGRVSNACVAVVAGHIALSLHVHPEAYPKGKAPAVPTVGGVAAAAAAETLSLPQVQSPRLRLTVLLDAVPDDAAQPSMQQMARFLSRVLEPSEELRSDIGVVGGRAGFGVGVGDREAGRSGAGDSREGRLLGEDVPELLVVENNERVVSSEFLHLDSTGPEMQSTAGLIYACIEADGLLRLWKWEAEGLGWRWTFLNECNICACRKDPHGSRVFSAAIGIDPEYPHRGGSRQRIIWEQEDNAEGAGLGLALVPAGPHPPRRVWSRRITFESNNYGDGDRDLDGGSNGYDEVVSLSAGGSLEIALGFSVNVLPVGVDTLLCGRLGAWMIAGERVFFNQFATGRLPEMCLPRQVSVGRGGEADADRFDGNDERSGSETFTDSEGDPEGDSLDDEDRGSDEGLADGAIGSGKVESVGWGPMLNWPCERLFAVHISTGDLVMYDPPGAIRVVSLPSGGGGLALNLQCRLEPPPSVPPQSLVARLNQAIFAGGGICSTYDLCTGRLLGRTGIPRCRACVYRQRHRSARYLGLHCTCGRQRQHRVAQGEPGLAEQHPVLWVSGTEEHLVGIVSKTQLLRVRLPGTEACVKAMLTMTQAESLPSPRVLQYIREYQRLVGGDDAWMAFVLPGLLRLRSSNYTAGDEHLETCGADVGMMDVLGFALSAEKRCNKADPNNSCRSIPPWLFLAMMSAAQEDRQRNVDPHRLGESETQGGYGGGGDPARAAAESQLRRALEAHIAESLRSLDRLRALLRDPAGSARQGTGIRISADDGAAEEIDAVANGVDPATALFEGILRSWLACRRGEEDPGGVRDGDVYSDSVAGERKGARGSGLPRTTIGGIVNSAAEDDRVALAFRCETAGEVETQEIPFLRFLLQESSAGSKTPSGVGGGEAKNNGYPFQSSSPTFLCLHLANNDASPMFEVACRALFRLRPLQLPRFVERLARFRTYADEMKDGFDCTAGGGDGSSNSGVGAGDDIISTAEEHGVSSAAASDLGVAGADDTNSLKHSRISRESLSSLPTRREVSPTSADDRRDTSSSIQSLSPALRQRAYTVDESSGHGDLSTSNPFNRASRHGKHKRPSSQDRSPEAAALGSSGERPPPPASAGGVLLASPRPENSTGAAAAAPPPSTAQAYFARALACLPPAVKDRRDGAQQRARLSLLMGARMFREACRLLRARAWEGESWRQDRGAARAWAAAMRLLAELQREAAEEGGPALRRSASFPSSPVRVDSAAASTAVAGPASPGNSARSIPGGAGLQYRLAFEDALAETILADTPDRMVMVMGYRPADLAPVAIVRMVRRAGAAAAAKSPTARVAAWGNVGNDVADTEPLSDSTTRTLKQCLLLLVEQPDANQGFTLS